MVRGKTPRTTVHPSLTPQRAVELLLRQLDRLGDVEKLHHDDPGVDAWEGTTESILHQAFGKPDGLAHDNTGNFVNCDGGQMWIGMDDYQFQQVFTNKMNRRRALLEAYIEQLEDLSPPSASIPGYQHSFHPDVERVAGPLFRDGHYKQAAQEAFVFVINSVKRKSRLNHLDGDNLMNQALSFKPTKRPLVQFNQFGGQAEMDEQQGLFFIFKGLVGLRNYKAHTNTLFNDRDRAYEYLAMASLLLRLLERASINDSE